MSEAAAAGRAWRQRRAAPGGRQDRIVRFAGIALPMAAGILVALLAMAPLLDDGDVSFLLDKNKVEVATERLRTRAAEYRGQDDRGAVVVEGVMILPVLLAFLRLAVPHLRI